MTRGDRHAYSKRPAYGGTGAGMNPSFIKHCADHFNTAGGPGEVGCVGQKAANEPPGGAPEVRIMMQFRMSLKRSRSGSCKKGRGRAVVHCP